MTNIECRRQMHYAEHLVRMGLQCPNIYRPMIEAAYLATTETKVAQRIQVALDQI